MTYRACISFMQETEGTTVPVVRHTWHEVEARGHAEAMRQVREVARGYRWRDQEGRQRMGRVLSVGAVSK